MCRPTTVSVIGTIHLNSNLRSGNTSTHGDRVKPKPTIVRESQCDEVHQAQHPRAPAKAGSEDHIDDPDMSRDDDLEDHCEGEQADRLSDAGERFPGWVLIHRARSGVSSP